MYNIIHEKYIKAGCTLFILLFSNKLYKRILVHDKCIKEVKLKLYFNSKNSGIKYKKGRDKNNEGFKLWVNINSMNTGRIKKVYRK